MIKILHVTEGRECLGVGAGGLWFKLQVAGMDREDVQVVC